MGETSQQRKRYPNFDVIRLAAATSVIFSHSFTIANGNEARDPLVQLLGPGNPIGIYGVFCFFIMSGFLVSRSVARTGSLKRLFLRRVLRIYPALIVCAVICGLVIAAFFFRDGAAAYLSTLQGPKFVAKVLLLRDPLHIEGVDYYADTHWIGGIINGSLWTLLQEAQFYGIVLVLAALGLFKPILAATGMIVGTLLFYLMTRGLITPGEGSATNILYALAAISAGMTMHFVHQRFGKVRSISLACAVGLALSIPFGLLSTLFPMLAAYPLVHLGMSESIRLGNVTRLGDVTYGTYLYGWPTQQLVRAACGAGLSGWLLFILAWPIALLCGFLSWHLIERHMVLAALTERWQRFWRGVRGDLGPGGAGVKLEATDEQRTRMSTVAAAGNLRAGGGLSLRRET